MCADALDRDTLASPLDNRNRLRLGGAESHARLGLRPRLNGVIAGAHHTPGRGLTGGFAPGPVCVREHIKHINIGLEWE